MGISNRIEGSVEKWRVAWGQALNKFLVDILGWGVELFFDILGKAAAPKLKPLIDSIEASGAVPPELQPILDELKSPSGEASALFAQSIGGGLIGGAMGRMGDALFGNIAHAMNRLHPTVPLGTDQVLTLWLRGQIPDEIMDDGLAVLGYRPELKEWLKLLLYLRLDPQSVITAWRRNPEKYQALFQDLKDTGWTEERIEVLKEITQFLPSADEQTLWLAREVFEPDMVSRYGLDDELPNYEETDFAKVAVTPEQMRNKWRAHWEHASYMQVREMLRRGVLNLSPGMPSPPTTKSGWEARDAEGIEAMFDWYRLVEIPPFWRDRLTEMVFEIPTRVDVRRFWDMRTIDEERLRDIYHAQGYHGKDLDDYILWTKVYVAYPDLLARFKNGWITEADVSNELIALGMPPDRVIEMIQTKIKPLQPERIANERNLTVTDIYKAVKMEVITRGQGLEMLQALGYDEAEASLKMAVNVPEEQTISETKARELTKSDVRAGLKAGIITETEAYSRLLELRYKPIDADLLMAIYMAVAKPPEQVRDREASKADIVKAVKDGLIEPEDGYLMLQDIGFTPEASVFILVVRAEVSPFSPASYGEMYKQVEVYRKAVGLKVSVMPEELVEAEKAYKQAKATLTKAESQKIEGEQLASYQKALSDTQYRYRQLLIAWEEQKKLKG